MSSRAASRWRRALALAGVIVGLWLGLNTEPHRTGIAADSAAIYALVLDALPADAPGWAGFRRVEARAARATYMDFAPARGRREFGWLLREFAGIQPATIADFERRQRDRTSLRGLLPRSGVWLVTPDDDGQPGAVPRRRAVHAVSHIGFDPERTQAVVYVSYVCGETCGSGHYAFLERRAGQWRISGSIMAWIS